MSRGLLTVHPRLKFGRHLQSSRIESTDFHLTRTVSITRDHSVSFSSQKRFSTWRLQIARDTDSLITTVLEQLDVASRFNVANTSSSDGRATALVPSRRGSWPPASRRWVKTNCSRASSWRPRLRYRAANRGSRRLTRQVEVLLGAMMILPWGGRRWMGMRPRSWDSLSLAFWEVVVNVPFRLPPRFKDRASRIGACKWAEPPRPRWRASLTGSESAEGSDRRFAAHIVVLGQSPLQTRRGAASHRWRQ